MCLCTRYLLLLLNYDTTEALELKIHSEGRAVHPGQFPWMLR